MLAPTTAAPAEPWVRSVGAPIRVPYRGTVAPIAPLAYRRTRGALAALPSRRRPRPRAAHSERVDVRGARRDGAGRGDGARVPRPVGRDGARRSDPPPCLEPRDRRCRRLRGRGLVPAARRAGGGARDRARTASTSRPSPRREPRTDLPAGRRILWVNRLDAQKGFPVALAAFSKVLAEIPDATLVVVGEGKDRESLRLLTEQALARVDMRGAVENAEVPGYHAACEVFVASAVGQESFGIAVVEAMAAGVPVVASDIPGYREVVHRRRGRAPGAAAGPGGARGRPGPRPARSRSWRSGSARPAASAPARSTGRSSSTGWRSCTAAPSRPLATIGRDDALCGSCSGSSRWCCSAPCGSTTGW